DADRARHVDRSDAPRSGVERRVRRAGRVGGRSTPLDGFAGERLHQRAILDHRFFIGRHLQIIRRRRRSLRRGELTMRRSTWNRSAMLGVAAIVALAAPALAVSPPDQYKTFNRDDVTIHDAKTHLEWERVVTRTPVAFGAAPAYCQGLTLLGHTDWRVPT